MPHALWVKAKNGTRGAGGCTGCWHSREEVSILWVDKDAGTGKEITFGHSRQEGGSERSCAADYVRGCNAARAAA